MMEYHQRKGAEAMRRHDREITDRAELLAVLDRCDTLRVAFSGEEYPYVVPLSFGWAEENGEVALYVHGAKAGLRHTLLARCPRVAVEADRMLGYAAIGQGLTCAYESVMGTGEARAVEGEEARRGLEALVRHCGFDGFDCGEKALAATSVWRIGLRTLTGKRRTLDG